MNIHFKLRSQGKSDPVITLQIFDSRFIGRKFMYSTGATVKASLWDKRRNRTKAAPAQPYEDELLMLNKHLDRLEKCVIEFLSERHNNKSIDRHELKTYIQNSMVDEIDDRSKEIKKESEFSKLWEHFIQSGKSSSGEPITSGTKRSKTQTLRLVEKYCLKKKLSLSFEKIDMTFYHDFDQYMQEQGLNSNTRGKHFKEIKAILREAEDRDIKVNTAFRKKSFKVVRTKPDNVYLNDEEIKKIFNLKFTPGLERQKDIFIMACYVGARHSDWNQIRNENIIVEGGKEMLRIKQTKTGEVAHVPVHSAVRAIINKYKGTPPPVITNQKFNEALKVICKKSELGTVNIGNNLVEKWTEISTHTARRSFATNAYLSRTMDVYQIMKCTGHKTEASFLRYLKLDGKDFAMQAADSKFFKDDSWTSLKIAS